MTVLERYNNKVAAWQYEYSEGKNSFFNDIEYYKEKYAKIKGRILELACGTGRITIPLKMANIDIIGLDNAKAMLDIARRKSEKANTEIPYILAGAIDFSLDEKFSAIFIPYNSISFIFDTDTFIKNIIKHLKKGGDFSFDLTRNDFFLPTTKSAICKGTSGSSEPIFIAELNVTIQRKVEITHYPKERKTESKFIFNYKDAANKEHNFETIMYHNAITPEEYAAAFTKHGLKVIEKREIPFERNKMKKVQVYYQMRYE